MACPYQGQERCLDVALERKVPVGLTVLIAQPFGSFKVGIALEIGIVEIGFGLVMGLLEVVEQIQVWAETCGEKSSVVELLGSVTFHVRQVFLVGDQMADSAFCPVAVPVEAHAGLCSGRSSLLDDGEVGLVEKLLRHVSKILSTS